METEIKENPIKSKEAVVEKTEKVDTEKDLLDKNTTEVENVPVTEIPFELVVNMEKIEENETLGSKDTEKGVETEESGQMAKGMEVTEVVAKMVAEESEELGAKNTEQEEVIADNLNVEEVPSTAANCSGLGLLAQYNSEPENSDTEVLLKAKDYRSQAINVDSDNESSDSSDDSTSSTENAEETANCRRLRRLHKKIDKRINTVSDEEDEDDEDDINGGKQSNKSKQPPKVKGELLLEDLPPIQDLHITVPEEECIELGRVHSIVDQLLLVSALPNSMLLNLDTVLFLDKGKRVLGEIFDVLGQVSEPLYCVRFNSNEQIKEKQINIGDVVYVAPKTEYTQFVILSSLMKMRGSDASWENDIEPPPRYVDYSDDEQERMARMRVRNKDRQNPTRQGPDGKRICSSDVVEVDDDNDDNESVISSSTVNSTYNDYSRGRGRGRGGRGYGRGRPQQQQQPQYYPQPDTSSWHSNYYQPAPNFYGQYQMPPQFMPPYNYGAGNVMPPHMFPTPPPQHPRQNYMPPRQN